MQLIEDMEVELDVPAENQELIEEIMAIRSQKEQNSGQKKVVPEKVVAEKSKIEK